MKSGNFIHLLELDFFTHEPYLSADWLTTFDFRIGRRFYVITFLKVGFGRLSLQLNDVFIAASLRPVLPGTYLDNAG